MTREHQVPGLNTVLPKPNLSRFTPVWCHHQGGLLTSPLRDRLGIQHLDYYSVDELARYRGQLNRLPEVRIPVNVERSKSAEMATKTGAHHAAAQVDLTARTCFRKGGRSSHVTLSLTSHGKLYRLSVCQAWRQSSTR